jgi:Lrp/AsnC family transcriptional regulator, regulator for asnA, asnC and gidA
MNGQLDETDEALLGLLQADSRATYASMAAVVGLSPAAVRKRVTRLFEQQIVRGVVVVNPLEVGVKVAALAGIRHRGALGSLEEVIQAKAEVMWAAITSGRYDMMIELGCSSIEELIDCVNDLRCLDEVFEVELFNVLRYVKFDQKQLKIHRPR